MTDAPQVRRDGSGGIDFDFYRKQAVALRAAPMREAFKGKAAFKVAAVSVAAGLALAAAVSLPKTPSPGQGQDQTASASELK